MRNGLNGQQGAESGKFTPDQSGVFESPSGKSHEEISEVIDLDRNGWRERVNFALQSFRDDEERDRQKILAREKTANN